MTKPIKKRRASFLTKIDIAILLCILVALFSVGVFIKYVLQKDTYVTVELLASGGEWWWGVPPPYYWNTQDISIGGKEYDSFKTPTAEIIDLVKYGEDERRFMWMKVKLRAKQNYLTREYSFKQEPLQVGKTIHIAPNNVAIIGQVVGIDGIGYMWDTEYITVTGEMMKVQPWESDAVHVGEKVVDNKGELVAEILDKHVEQADITATTWTGEVLHRKDPLLQDVTLKMKLRVMKDGDMRYFNFYQPISIGVLTRIQFAQTAVEINIMSVEASQ